MRKRISDHQLMKLQVELENNIGYLKGFVDENAVPAPIREIAKVLAKIAETQIELIERNLEG
jgi:hypothetical protein